MKKIAMVFLAAMLVFSVTACGGKTDSEKTGADPAGAAATEEEAIAIPAEEETWEVIATPYGDLRYPASLYEDLKREEGTEDDVYKMKFSTAYDGVTYDLFTLYIGGEVGDATYLGTLKGKDGSENEVYVLPHELENLSKLDTEQQDKIFAMQEALNEVLGE